MYYIQIIHVHVIYFLRKKCTCNNKLIITNHENKGAFTNFQQNKCDLHSIISFLYTKEKKTVNEIV